MQKYKFIHRVTECYPLLKQLAPVLEQATEMIICSIQAKGKILVCGNGGSAADAEHIVGELLKGFLLPRRITQEQTAALVVAFPDSGAQLAKNLQQAIPAISLVSGVSFPTAFANDVTAEYVFAQQVFGLAKEGDILWGLSTSGNSRNLLRAFQVARAFKVKTLGFTGRDGGDMAALCDVEVRVPHYETPVIQEMHMPMYHAICAELEAHLF